MTTDRCDCKQLEDELDAFHRGELSDDQTEALRRHLAECRHCACIEQHEQAFLARLRTMGKTGCCPEALKAKVLQRCAEEARDH